MSPTLVTANEAAAAQPASAPPARSAAVDPAAVALAQRYRAIRERSLALAAPLSPEDAMLQSMAEASPAKWHLAHTSWFFEQFVLALQRDYRAVDADWAYLFNSYYQSVGPMHARPQRGLLSRPSLTQVLDYRARIDERIARALGSGDLDAKAQQRIELGLQHEQQHQELLLTDIKHAFWCNPLRPAYRDDLHQCIGSAPAPRWIGFDESLATVGAPVWPGEDPAQSVPFAYDNESPRHRVLLPAYALAQHPVSNADYRAFIDDGGYRAPMLWLSEGWNRINAEGWRRPLYWDDDLEREFTLGGVRAIDPAAPVCHLSYFEADAFARWAGARLPTEFEWERMAAHEAVEGNLLEAGLLQPQAPPATAGMQQAFGDVWEWTASAYAPYPGFRPLPGALGEYNGKFMCGPWVLRGGSCATPRDHLRATYRNFFAPSARWQFSGLRLARDA